VLLAGATAAALMLGHYAGFSSWPDLLSGGKGTNAGSASLVVPHKGARAHGRGKFLNLGPGALPFATGAVSQPLPLPGVAPTGTGVLVTNNGQGGPGNGGGPNGGGPGNGGGSPGGAVTGPGAGTPTGPEGPATPVNPPQQTPPSGGSGGPQPPTGTTPGETKPPPTQPSDDGGGNSNNGGGGCDGSDISSGQLSSDSQSDQESDSSVAASDQSEPLPVPAVPPSPHAQPQDDLAAAQAPVDPSQAAAAPSAAGEQQPGD
jgi:hypothetical protein